MESGAINNSQIRASSEYNGKAGHAANQGRLNFQETNDKAGSWAAGTNDDKQWLQIDLGNQQTKVTRVATQGRNYNGLWPWGSHQQWITRYKLQYRNDTANFQYYKEQGQTTAKVSPFWYIGTFITKSRLKKKRSKLRVLSICQN